MVARAYEHGKAINTASHFEIDDVIDPADSRARVASVLASAPAAAAARGEEAPLHRHLVSVPRLQGPLRSGNRRIGMRGRRRRLARRRRPALPAARVSPPQDGWYWKFVTTTSCGLAGGGL